MRHPVLVKYTFAILHDAFSCRILRFCLNFKTKGKCVSPKHFKCLVKKVEMSRKDMSLFSFFIVDTLYNFDSFIFS